MVDDLTEDTFCNIQGKIYSKEEIKKYGLVKTKEDKQPKKGYYRCCQIFWHFNLKDDNAARNLSKFLIRKAQDFMSTPDKWRKSFEDRREIPVEIHCLEKRLVPNV